MKSPKLRGEEESGEEEAELNLKKPTPGIFLKTIRERFIKKRKKLIKISFALTRTYVQ